MEFYRQVARGAEGPRLLIRPAHRSDDVTMEAAPAMEVDRDLVERYVMELGVFRAYADTGV